MRNEFKETVRSTGLALAALVALTGCQRESVQSYPVPKEDYSVKAAGVASPHGMEAPAADARPHVHWELPKGWEEKAADSMSVGKFRIPADGGKFADVKIIPIPGGSAIPNMEQEMVRMWKDELQLGSEVPSVEPKDVEVGGAQGKLYDLTGVQPTFQGKHKGRITTAILSKDGTWWFIKMSGEESVVAGQQSAFREFLRSLSFHEESHDAAQATATATAAPAPEAGVEARWKGQEGWTPVAPSQMVLAAYSVKGKANVTVTSFPGDVGGMFANVNRWRGQMGLGPIQESELASYTKALTLSDGTKATAVEISGGGKVNYTLVVPRAGQTWFYKLIGDAETVAAEKERLTEFAATAK